MKRRGFLKTGVIIAGCLLIPTTGYSLVRNNLDNKPIEGANLKFYKYPEGDFIAEYLTDSKGDYNPATGVESISWRDIKLLFKDDSARKLGKLAKVTNSNIVRADITHPECYDAKRYFDASKGKLDTMMMNKSFDMGFFDAWARGGKKVLRRWNTNPKWYINTTNAEQAQIDLVEEIINVDLAEFTNGFFHPTIEEIAENKEERGSMLVYWVEEEDYYGNHNEAIENNEIVSGSTWFAKKNHLRRIYLRQLTQCLGLVNNGVSGRDFWTDEGYYTQQGLDCGKFLYSSKIGNISPDTEPEPIL